MRSTALMLDGPKLCTPLRCFGVRNPRIYITPPPSWVETRSSPRALGMYRVASWEASKARSSMNSAVKMFTAMGESIVWLVSRMAVILLVAR